LIIDEIAFHIYTVVWSLGYRSRVNFVERMDTSLSVGVDINLNVVRADSERCFDFKKGPPSL